LEYLEASMGTASDAVGRPLTVTTATDTDVSMVVEPLFREYGQWVASRLQQDVGITFTDADLARHHDGFRGELPRLLGSRGRLLVARLGDNPVGVGTLKPVDDTTAEIKRMYVRPAAQGLGVGRAILVRLVQDARAEGYATVRLETLRFMTTARTMYRAFDFVEVARFDGSEAANTVLEPLTIFMELDLAAPSPTADPWSRPSGTVGRGGFQPNSRVPKRS
jgi:GNAT superfamily N-acetyltransferase